MKTFGEFITELTSKGKGLDDVQQYHSTMATVYKTKLRSDAQDFHRVQNHRAKRIQALRDNKIKPNHIDFNKRYNRQDSKRAKELKSRIKPSQYR